MTTAILIFSILSALSGILFFALIVWDTIDERRKNKKKILIKATSSELLNALTDKGCVIESVRVHDDNQLDIRVSGGQGPEYAKQFRRGCLIYILDENADW